MPTKTEFHVNKITYNPFIKNWIMCVRYRTNILWWYQICTRSGRLIGKEHQAKCKYSKFEWEKSKRKGRYENMRKEILIVIGIIIFIILITLISSITTVGTGFVGVKTRFGKVQDTVIQEGFNFKTPFIEKNYKNRLQNTKM